MIDLASRIRILLGEAAFPPDGSENAGYHSSFVDSGLSKANYILTSLNNLGLNLSDYAYFSIGGSTGSEIIHVLKNSPINRGILLEYDDYACSVARNRLKEISHSKHIEIVTGDATQKIEQCRNTLLDWRKSKDIKGITCSIQAVLHELPTRSPNHELQYLLGEIIWDWDPFYLFCREPCSPQVWPERVKLSINNIPSEQLEALANHIRAMLNMEGDVRRAGVSSILLHKDIAVELLFKLFYIEDYSHEIEERVTSLDPNFLLRVLHSILKNGSISNEFMNSESFNRLYNEYKVSASTVDENPLNPPLTFLRIFASRNSALSLKSNDSKISKSVNVDNDPQRIVTSQINSILNHSLLPWSPRKSPSLRILWPDLLVDPELFPHKIPGSKKRLEEWNSIFQWSANISIIGQPGSGKSTCLRKMYLELANIDPKANSIFPVYGHVSDFVQYSHGNHDGNTISTAISYAKTSKYKVVYLVDALDEIDSSLIDTFYANFLSELSDNEIFICSCRTEHFFHQIGSVSKYNQLFKEILELSPWSEKDTKWFVKEYSEKLSMPYILNNFNVLFETHPDIQYYSSNPFHLTLLLYIVSIDKNYNNFSSYVKAYSASFDNIFSLYDYFYRSWLKKETHRGTTYADEGEIRNLHTNYAKALFEKRDAIFHRHLTIGKAESSVIQKNTAISDLLELNNDASIIYGFKHETLAEYLIAKHLLDNLFDTDSNLNELLLTTYTYDINKLFRESLSLFDDNTINKLVNVLTERYYQYLADDKGSKSDVDIDTRIREQILYYIGRIPTINTPKVLYDAYHNEHNSILMRIAALGLILHGDNDIEIDYMSKLKIGSDHDLDNRSIQLIYFEDVHGDIFTFRDNACYQWNKTRDAILNRLNINNTRNIRLRLWDLKTYKSFMLTRVEDRKVSESEYNIIKNSCTREDTITERIKMINAEINEILEILEIKD